MFKCFQVLLVCILAYGATLSESGDGVKGNDGQRNSAVPASAISMKPCEVPGTQEAVKEKVLCGTLDVFEDRLRKNGRQIALKIVVFPANGQEKVADPLFYIPGGPGSSATEDAPFVAREFAKIRERRDLVFVDQRGTGGSNPLNCDFFKPSTKQQPNSARQSRPASAGTNSSSPAG